MFEWYIKKLLVLIQMSHFEGVRFFNHPVWYKLFLNSQLGLVCWTFGTFLPVFPHIVLIPPPLGFFIFVSYLSNQVVVLENESIIVQTRLLFTSSNHQLIPKKTGPNLARKRYTEIIDWILHRLQAETFDKHWSVHWLYVEPLTW